MNASSVNFMEDHDAIANTSNNYHLPNGYDSHQAENGISSLQLNDDVEQKSSEDEEEERMRYASDSAIRRAFRGDESTSGSADAGEYDEGDGGDARSFVRCIGLAPNWTERVPEDQWIDRLRRLRQPPRSTRTFQNF